jgi:hypothetical protein
MARSIQYTGRLMREASGLNFHLVEGRCRRAIESSDLHLRFASKEHGLPNKERPLPKTVGGGIVGVAVATCHYDRTAAHLNL